MCFFSKAFRNYSKSLVQNVNISKIRFSVSISSKSEKKPETMIVLNVAEKNDAAKNIASLLSRGNSQRRNGLSRFNLIYEFDMNLWNRNCKMIMTSVSGHLLTYEFTGAFRSWQGCNPLSLFEAPVIKECKGETAPQIKSTLEREARKSEALIIWTDCDREGENIGFEVIEVCRNVKPNLRIYRANFSEITMQSITRAIQNLTEPNRAVSDAVDVRSELDLRIGAAFTRFQTLRLQQVFPRTLTDKMISYGSCQFPTLGFVVERFLAIDRFKPEPYWKIKVQDDRDNICVEFRWARQRLFEKLPCQVILDICLENPRATVVNVVSKEKKKWRPVPLDTVEMEKLGSRKLRMSAKETMSIAERLYTRGFISYPRTETNIFPKELNLHPLVEQQSGHAQWGQFAQRVLEEGICPRQGKKSDKAHPPIHPTKFTNDLRGNEARVYEFIVRHFLACISKDAVGFETTVEIDIAGEKFTANGLQIIAKNYLEVYIYEKWNAKEIHIYEPHQVFEPTSITMVEEETSPPSLLTEADLIALMDKHGIGTDATHAEHIETIKSREYVGLKDNRYFLPGKLGLGLVMGYDNMGFQMSKPNLRAELENDLKLICEGQKEPQEVLQTQIANYREVFRVAMERANLIDIALAEYLDEQPSAIQVAPPIAEPEIFCKCPRCGQNMALRDTKDGGKMIGCMGYPTCKNTMWFPQKILEIKITNDVCNECPGGLKKLAFKFRPMDYPILGPFYTACVGGCDQLITDVLNLSWRVLRPVEQPNVPVPAAIEAPRPRPQPNARPATATAPNARPLANSNASRGSFAAAPRPGVSRSAVGLMGPPSARPPQPPAGRGNNAKRSTNWDDKLAPKRPKTMPTNSRENVQPQAGDILCDCHQPAVLSTVTKQSENKGRMFYRCGKPPNEKCIFFLWADNAAQATVLPAAQNRADQQRNQPAVPGNSANDSRNQAGSNYQSHNRPGPSGAGGSAPMCDCGKKSSLMTVRKENENCGRQFYGCPTRACKFFQWADGVANDYGGSDTAAGRGRGRGAPAARGAGRGGTRASGPRKCSICGAEGHNKRKCPQNSMD